MTSTPDRTAGAWPGGDASRHGVPMDVHRTPDGGSATLGSATLGSVRSLIADRQNRSLFFTSYVLALLAYSYLFVGTVYNNHDLPNSFYMSYPSFTTTDEGRFIGDIIYQLQGGSAVPSLHMAVAVAVQIINGFLTAACLGLTSYRARLCTIVLVTIHPVITDYYSWGGVALNFCLADTFAIAAILLCARTGLKTAVLATLCVVLCVATYQPKVSILATVCLLHVMARLAGAAPPFQTAWDLYRFWARVAGVVVAAAVTYFAIYSLTVSPDVRQSGTATRLHLNAPAEIVAQAGQSFLRTTKYFFTSENFLHPNDWFLTLLVGGGFVAMALARLTAGGTSRRSHLGNVAMFLLCLGLLPLAMNAVFLITAKTDASHGRFYGAYAYALAGSLGLLLEWSRTRLWSAAWSVVFAALALFFVFDDAQYGYRGYMQNRFEYSFVTRIVTRIENLIDGTKTYKLVVKGDLPWIENRGRLSRKGNINQRQVIANYDSPGFIHYRRLDYLNFLMGKTVFTHMGAEDQAEALRKVGEYEKTARRWPDKEAVAVLDDVVVVLF